MKQHVDAQLKTLFELLIAPLGLELSGKKLVVIPHGPLHAVPFSVLFDGTRYLVEAAQLSLAPSAAVYFHCLQRPTGEAGAPVAFGVPLEELPAVEEELAAITGGPQPWRTFLGEDASRAAFFEQASAAKLLHLATHGVYRPDAPMSSGLRLGDGWLTARDLYGLKLQASLVVLLACESGLAGQGGGDEQFGLVRGFLYAGAPALAVSLWPVKDAQTAQRMVAFYDALYRGLGVGAALREAQLEVRVHHPNPYYWAAFTVIGDPHRRVA